VSGEVPQPRTVWERPADEVASGGRVLLRGAVFQIGGQQRSGVVLTIGGEGQDSATVLLNPDEAQGLAVWLREAADAALATAPPMYD
jgi:hypothetical protein